MKYRLRAFTERDGHEVADWQYPPPFDLYDPGVVSRDFAQPERRYRAVLDGAGALVGYCCFGEDARVPGGPCAAEEPAVLDVGLGLRPELTGRGHGAGFARAVLEHGIAICSPARLRVTIAEFNQRSLRCFQRLGFAPTLRFVRPADGLAFQVLERDATRQLRRA